MKQSTTPATAQAMRTTATKASATRRTSKKEASTPQPSAVTSRISITVGLDLCDRHSHFCVLDDGCQPLEQGRVAMSRKDLTVFFQRIAPARLVLEVGGQSPWVSRLAQAAGLEVIVANPRRVQLITRNERTDAELLARLGRVDPQLLSPVQHRSVECQADLAVKRARDVAVASRTALINHVRGAIKSFGQRLPTCSPDGFYKRVVTHLPVELVPALQMSVNADTYASALFAQAEPRTSKGPFAIDGAGRDPECFRRLVDAEPGIESHLHYLRRARVLFLQAPNRRLERQDFLGIDGRGEIDDIERHLRAPTRTAAFVAARRSRVLHQDAPHRLRRSRVEVRSILELQAGFLRETQVRLVHTRCRLKHVVAPLEARALLGDRSELLVHERQNPARVK